jgi:predicted nucleic acid-binding protein
VRTAVLDSSVILKWYRGEGEGDREAALALRRQYLDGQLALRAPSLLALEILNAAARRWRWPVEELFALADELDRWGVELREPPWEGVADWAGRGLTAYDAAYVALAEDEGVPLITADRQILTVAPHVARRLGDDW